MIELNKLKMNFDLNKNKQNKIKKNWFFENQNNNHILIIKN
jgi:hypothetical protein